MDKNKIFNILSLSLILFYLGVSFFVVDDFGLTWDSPDNLGIGHKYLNFYKTGFLNFRDDIPKIPSHPNFYNDVVKYYPYMPESLANILSAASCYLFYQQTKLLDPIPAHHIIIPILVSFFLFFLYGFVKKHWGSSVGLVTLIVLLSMPRFFGHSFNNIKDIPELVFFSATIIIFTQAFLSKNLNYFYLGCIFLGIALATKKDAILIPAIMLPWAVFCVYREKIFNIQKILKNFLRILLGVLLTALTFISAYPPLFWSGESNLNFFQAMLNYTRAIGMNPANNWNLYAPTQILYTTPEVIIILFLIGLVRVFLKGRDKLTNLLLFIWLLLPVIRHCLPGAVHYDGLRHFIVFVVPFSIIASIGMVDITKPFSRLTKIKKEFVVLLAFFVYLACSINTLIKLHPYQTTYFNSFVGGLSGAQKKNIPFSSDYWLNSYKEASSWLSKNAKEGAFYYAYPNKEFFSEYYIERPDLKLTKKMLPNTYFVLIPRKWYYNLRYEDLAEFSKLTNQMEEVYSVKRQKGEIVTIYYNP